MRSRKTLRLKTFGYLGVHRYSLTICTERRQRLFKRGHVVLLVLSQISRSAADHQFAILAYCFMPNHLHLLVEGLADTSDFRRFVANAKQYSGFDGD
jgi:putative transposase